MPRTKDARGCVGCSRFLCPSAKIIVAMGTVGMKKGEPHLAINDPMYPQKSSERPRIAYDLKQALRKKAIDLGDGMIIFELSKKIPEGGHAKLNDLMAIAFVPTSNGRASASALTTSKQRSSTIDPGLKRIQAAVHKSWLKLIQSEK
jgi:hypothetical protein